jgi:hypothetical protein
VGGGMTEELLELGRAAASKLDLTSDIRVCPAFSDTEDVCGEEYEQMLQLLHTDEVFAPVDLERQERLAEAIKAALPPGKRDLVDDLIDNHARHVWLQQEGAYHLGLAVGLRLALLSRGKGGPKEH